MAERLFLLDGTALAYRAYFAFLNARLSDRKGRPTGAVYGFVATLLKLIEDEKPDHVGVCFDPPGPTFRHKRYAEYKATRQRMDEDLVAQLPVLREVVQAFNIPVLEVEGFEADDVMATVARRSAERGIDAYIVTGDKDLCQCVGEHVRIYNILKPGQETVVLDAEGVREEWGVAPPRVVDVLALMGDASDNVPGVRGIGPKTAIKLVQEHGGVDEILAKAERGDESIPPKLREKILEHREDLELSHELVTVKDDVPLQVGFEKLRVGPRDEKRLQELFNELNFTTFLAKVTTTEARTEEHDYRLVRTLEEVAALVERLRAAPLFAVDTETTHLDPLRCTVVGVSFSCEGGRGWYVPLNLGGLDAKAALDALRPLLEDPERRKAGQNAKYDVLALRGAGVSVRGYEIDTMIASFCLDPDVRQHNLDALALRHFGYRKIPTKDLIGSGKAQRTMAEAPVEDVARYACEDADFTFRLARLFLPRLEREEVGRLFREVEMPLMPVLADMEAAGVRVDVARLDAMSRDLAARAAKLEREICEIAGQAFNVNSPKQLGPILFEKLKIQGGRRVRSTSTGYATDERTLSQFADHEIVRKLLEYRGLTKLRGTYTEALAALVNPRTGRVHTSYSQVAAVTGRLASSDPNLQNIPIRTEEGRRIRRAFVPREKGWQLLSADYSQIELRILAHLSGDEALRAAFAAGEDIHRQTAARVFGVAPELVTPELRSRAKAINFGIVYGMGANRLAEETGMTRKEASDFISKYFEAYPGVLAYLERSKREARERGWVATLLGRRRSLRGLYESSDERVQATADNVAVNTPIQGSAADVIKIAMIRIHDDLRSKGLATEMILQVHDELVFDVAPGELDAVRDLVRGRMEGAYEMSVPLVVDMGWGEDWLAAH